MKYTIAQILKDNTASLQYIKEGKAFYRIAVKSPDNETDITFYQFPIDMSNKEDVGTGKFLLEQKATELMRWLRKAIAADDVMIW